MEPELSELVTKIANEIVEESILSNYLFYLIFAAISLLSSAASAYLTSYFRKQGEFLATKKSFDDFKKQLKETTKITSEIKEELDHKRLIHDKLERLFSQTFVLPDRVRQTADDIKEGKSVTSIGDAINQIQTLQGIYFPEAHKELECLTKKYDEMQDFLLSEYKMSDASNADEAYICEKYIKLYHELRDLLVQFRTKLVEIYPDIVKVEFYSSLNQE